MFNQQEHLEKIARCHLGPHMVGQLFEMKSYDMCSQLAQEMIKVDPNNVESKMWLAKCSWMMGKNEDAKLQFQQALEISKEFSPSNLSEYCHFLCDEKDLLDQQVIDELLVFQREEEDSDALFKIALATQKLKSEHKRHKNSEMITNSLMSKASELKPDSSEEKYTKAAMCFLNGNIEEGIELHTQIIKETKDYRSFYDLGFLFLKLDKIDIAINYFINSFIQNPLNMSALNQIFRILDSFKSPQTSIKICQMLMEEVPLHGSLYSTVMNHLIKMNLKKEAIDLMKERAEKDDNKMAAWQMLSELYLQDENWDEAIIALQESIKTRNGIDPINYTNLSTAYFKKENYLKALECIQTSLIQNPEKAIPYQNLIQLRKNNYVSLEQVQQIYNSLIEQSPKLNKNALQYFQSAKELNLDDFEYMSNLFKQKNDNSDFTHFIEKHTLPDCQKCKCC